LFIQVGTLYQHLHRIGNVLGTRNYFEMLHMLHKQPEDETPMLRFSPRGKEVFTLMTQGVSIKRIGECLGMSVSGVRRHREKMLLQNNCKSMLELVAKYHGMDGTNPEANHPAD
jgi:DNA-binding CsgD family transcriptional regulator